MSVKESYAGKINRKLMGLKNFEFLMQSGKLLDLTKNTILYNLAFIFLGNIIAMLMAVLLNEIHNKYFKKVSHLDILAHRYCDVTELFGAGRAVIFHNRA